jgi:hypothetical protein
VSLTKQAGRTCLIVEEAEIRVPRVAARHDNSLWTSKHHKNGKVEHQEMYLILWWEVELTQSCCSPLFWNFLLDGASAWFRPRMQMVTYLIHGGNATLPIHAKHIFCPERAFSVQIDLPRILSQHVRKDASAARTRKYLKNGSWTRSCRWWYRSSLTLSSRSGPCTAR